MSDYDPLGYAARSVETALTSLRAGDVPEADDWLVETMVHVHTALRDRRIAELKTVASLAAAANDNFTGSYARLPE